jgi:hypothetical protein
LAGAGLGGAGIAGAGLSPGDLGTGPAAAGIEQGDVPGSAGIDDDGEAGDDPAGGLPPS